MYAPTPDIDRKHTEYINGMDRLNIMSNVQKIHSKTVMTTRVKPSKTEI